MKLMIWLIALSLFFLLSEVGQTSKKQETPQAIERQDFFKDLNHKRHQIMTGNWVYELDIFRKYPRNATCPRYDTFKTRCLGLKTREWDFTVATTSRAWHSMVAMAAQAWNECYSITMTVTARIWNGATWMADWIWDQLTWLVELIWDRVILLAESGDELPWLTEWTLNGITWMAGCVWDGVTWAAKPFTVEFNNVADVAAKFYGEYLDRHVKHAAALVISMTWQDVFYMMSIDLVLSYFLFAFYLLLSCAVNFIRRQWQAHKYNKDKRSAANLPPAPTKPIWQPKPKKIAKRRNNNTW